MAAMIVRLDVDAVAAAHEAHGAEFAAATIRCLLCDHSIGCRDWLANPNRDSDPPAFWSYRQMLVTGRVRRQRLELLG
jgi:Family of unknown function (DUF6455)